MTDPAQQSPFYIGWDVGGWNCDKNRESRDAIVILNEHLDIIGTPWRGNLRLSINKAKTTRDWLEQLFTLCRADLPNDNVHAILAIDTPLGFSNAFTRLISHREWEEPIGQSACNPYLFRQTERFLFENGITPLSPIKDMIGSQAPKGIHTLAKFAPQTATCGVWTDGDLLTAIEAYPSPCKHSPLVQALLNRYRVAPSDHASEPRWIEQIHHQDINDALICALVGHLFATQPESLAHPKAPIPAMEGWIWVPNDALRPSASELVVID